jgi:hypothetical protein
VIGLAQAVHDPPRSNEIIERVTALAALAAVMTVIIVSLPPELWESIAPVTLLFPILLWLAAGCQPVFAAGAAFIERKREPRGSRQFPATAPYGRKRCGRLVRRPAPPGATILRLSGSAVFHHIENSRDSDRNQKEKNETECQNVNQLNFPSPDAVFRPMA